MTSVRAAFTKSAPSAKYLEHSFFERDGVRFIAIQYQQGTRRNAVSGNLGKYPPHEIAAEIGRAVEENPLTQP